MAFLLLFYCISKIFILSLSLSPDITARSLLALLGHANATLRDHVFRTLTVYDVTECGLLCLRDLRCKSFNMCNDKDKILCELNSATNEGFSLDDLMFILQYHYSKRNSLTH